jgi:hypothetical protein
MYVRDSVLSLYKVYKVKSNCKFFFNWYSGRWSPIGSTRHCCHQWPIVTAPGDYDDGEIGGMIGRGNRSTRRKPAPVPLCPPQTPHAARTRTRSAAVGSQRLTAWATARPNCKCILTYLFPCLSIHLQIWYSKLLNICRRNSEHWTLSEN